MPSAATDSILSLAKKLDRALRNGTALKVTPDEVVAMVDEGIAGIIDKAKTRELVARRRASTEALEAMLARAPRRTVIPAQPTSRGGPRPELTRESIAALTSIL